MEGIGPMKPGNLQTWFEKVPIPTGHDVDLRDKRRDEFRTSSY
ncbi:hypothetical protein B4166_1794 [Caldibacillus thermoamylovorans]|uniref:Uncharacterized protein n=1 Tax=Caldibacillus thermoamylovorans TaxID=35841 RepID=A0ABD4A9G4_9BACI|nr:hypothetical protein B4166_1794 [Caldibacillus thermoamylovorans]KIO72877.1 hypothetical protein B4167_2653 [Caldibacillus thermoamylovorans]